jgi:NTE family protein
MTVPDAKPACILVLQGGGAMGAYHIGAFQALQEGGFEPDWVCGISMGAINGAIIAGNVAERRLERLDAFWNAISRPSVIPPFGGTSLRSWEHKLIPLPYRVESSSFTVTGCQAFGSRCDLL